MDIFAEPEVAASIGKPESANFIAVAYNLTQKRIGIFNTDVTDPSMGVEITVNTSK